MKTTRIKLIKLSDNYFEGNHPNGIYEGHTEVGSIESLPKVGERFWLQQNTRYPFSTSIVTKECNIDNIFKTTYSTYKIEFLDENEK